MKDLLDRIRPLQADLAAIRQDIHAHPEIGMDEHRTAALVAAKLREWGLEVTEGVGRFGVVGTLNGRPAGAARHRPARRHGRAVHRGTDRQALRLGEQGADACLRA